MKRLTTIIPKRRKHLYRVTQAVLGLLVVYGVIAGDLVAGWAVLAAAIFEVPIANVPDED